MKDFSKLLSHFMIWQKQGTQWMQVDHILMPLSKLTTHWIIVEIKVKSSEFQAAMSCARNHKNSEKRKEHLHELQILINLLLMAHLYNSAVRYMWNNADLKEHSD